jgi:hypothetical protein
MSPAKIAEKFDVKMKPYPHSEAGVEVCSSRDVLAAVVSCGMYIQHYLYTVPLERYLRIKGVCANSRTKTNV